MKRLTKNTVRLKQETTYRDIIRCKGDDGSIKQFQTRLDARIYRVVQDKNVMLDTPNIGEAVSYFNILGTTAETKIEAGDRVLHLGQAKGRVKSVNRRIGKALVVFQCPNWDEYDRFTGHLVRLDALTLGWHSVQVPVKAVVNG